MLGKEQTNYTFWGGELPKTDIKVELPQGYFKGEEATREEWKNLRFWPLRYIMYKELVKMLRPGKYNHVPQVLFVGEGAVGFAMDTKKMFGREVKAVALEESALTADLARRAVRASGLWLDVIVGELSDLPFREEEFDVVFANLSFAEKNFSVKMTELRRILAHEGGMIFRVLDLDRSFPWSKTSFAKWWHNVGFFQGSRRGVSLVETTLEISDHRSRFGKVIYFANKILRFLRAKNIIVKLVK